MNYKDLIDFIENRMSMSHIYQPLMIKSLIEAGGFATIRQLAHNFLSQDESQLLYYENRIKQMPLRGGVYFEAGFAYGLGMPVIYTCRKDWCDLDQLRDGDGNVIKTLKDSHDRDIRVMKKGVHFDLAHRNRIEWEIDKLNEFKVKLENRIKAVIV